MRTNNILIFFFLFIFFLFSCTDKVSEEEKESIYKDKGFYTMKKHIKPEIIKTTKVNNILGVNIQNTFGTITNKGEFGLAKIENTGKIEVTPIVPGFPPVYGEKYYSDDEHNLMWMTRGRGFYALDMETKETGHIIVSHDGNDGILNTFVLDHKKKLFYMEVVEYRIYGNHHYYIIFDLLNKSIAYKSDYLKGFFYPFTEKQLLFYEIYGEGNKLIRWHIVDFYGQNSIKNKLTEKLTEVQFDAWNRTKTIHTEKRAFLGVINNSNPLIYISARWDEELEEVKVEPFTIQKPQDTSLDTAFVFSQKGGWVKSTLKYRNSMFPARYLIFYNTGNMYPQGLSPPVFAGYTKENTPGAFMHHDEWGDCYIEQDPDYRDKLFIYKLNDGMKILAEMATGG